MKMNSRRQNKRERWPTIKEALNHGKPVFVVDARIKGNGERKYFATMKEAEGEQQRQRVKRANEGLSGMAVPEKLRIEAMECQRRLKPVNASLTNAVDFFLRHAKPAGGHRTAKELVKEFIDAKRAAGSGRNISAFRRRSWDYSRSLFQCAGARDRRRAD